MALSFVAAVALGAGIGADAEVGSPAVRSGMATLLSVGTADAGAVRLSGHTQAGLPAKSTSAGNAPMTLTFVLRHDDEAGFQHYLRDVYDSSSGEFHQYLSPQQQAERFGPSQQYYDQLAAWLGAHGFGEVERSANRMSLAVSAPRAVVESTLAIHIDDYAGNGRTFFANDGDPALPADLAAHVQAIAGLSDRARPAPLTAQAPPDHYFQCPAGRTADCDLYGPLCAIYAGSRATGEFLMDLEGPGKGVRDYNKSYDAYNKNVQDYYEKCLNNNFPRPDSSGFRADSIDGTTPWNQIDGAGQTIGLVEFDQYQTSDISAFLQLIGAPADQIDNLSEVSIGAGASFGGAESEVVLDIDVAMSLAPAASVVVYSASFSGAGSFQIVFNRMISDGVDVISNSWAYCENQTTQADVDSIDAILQSAAVAGISVFSGSGDSGSTCLNGSPNTVAVPASSPHITAVGGTSLVAGPGGVRRQETWWDGSTHQPATGQGGFGVSRFFARPDYQTGFTSSTMRSIPDVSMSADPAATGMVICQADASGCPTASLYGGTSMATPIMASFTALLNQAGGTNLGFVNAGFYALAATPAFHSAASMSSDFAHVGLGSPDLSALNLALRGQSAGAVSAGESETLATAPPVQPFTSNYGVPADGATPGYVIVTLRDASGNTVPDKSVSLAANAGSHATITPPSGVSGADGVVMFTVTDLTAEELTFTATDTSDGITLASAQKLLFIAATATNGSITAAPTQQAADGESFSTVTVTLEDALGRPVAGKLVQLAQSGNSPIFGDNPAATDASGEAVFVVTDSVSEVVSYTAVDVTDGNLPVPGVATVTWSNGIGCGSMTPPVAAPGYAVSLYASGFPVQNGVTFGGITISGCVGVGGIAFDAAGHLFASDYVTGDVYDIPPGGAIVGDANRITATPLGVSLGSLAFVGGNLYAARVATTGDFTTGAVLKVNTINGTATTVSSNLPCPFSLAGDPLSGDVFVTDGCTGNGSDNASIWRVAHPGGSPSTSVYAESSGSPNGGLDFADDGTLYVVHSYFFGGAIDVVSGTNQAQPASVQPIDVGSTFTVTALGSAPDGGAAALVVGASRVGGYAESVAAYDMTLNPPAFSGAVLEETGAGGNRIIGPDGCFYLNASIGVYRLSNADGTCPNAAQLTPNPSLVIQPSDQPPIAAQGVVQNFTVFFPHTDVPVGTPVTVVVSGANSLQQVVFMGFGTGAAFSYVGRNAGDDTVQAFWTVDDETVTSNRVPVVWTSGRHTTYLTLNGSANAGNSGGVASATATLLDLSVDPAVPVPNADVVFTIGAATCTATTNASGVASCGITLGAPGVQTLAANYAGTSAFLPATDTLAFHVLDDTIFANGFDGN